MKTSPSQIKGCLREIRWAFDVIVKTPNNEPTGCSFNSRTWSKQDLRVLFTFAIANITDGCADALHQMITAHKLTEDNRLRTQDFFDDFYNRLQNTRG